MVKISCMHSIKLCSSCKKQRWKEKDITRYYYYRLKERAKRRGKAFDLTLDEFRILCEETGYIRLRQAGYDATWDRVRERDGYSFSNMQMLVRTDNIKKFKSFLRDGNWSSVVPRELDDPF